MGFFIPAAKIIAELKLPKYILNNLTGKSDYPPAFPELFAQIGV